MAAEGHGRIEAPWGKWSIVLGYWLIQAAVAYFLWPALLEGLNHWSFCFEWEYFVTVAPVIAMITSMQAVLLIPVHRPGVAPGKSLRLAVPVIGATAIGLTGGYLTVILAIAWDLTSSMTLGFEEMMLLAWASTLTCGLAALVWLLSWRPSGIPAVVSFGIMALAAAHLTMAVALVIVCYLQYWLPQGLSEFIWCPPVIGIFVGSWILGTVLMLRFCRQRPVESALQSLAARIFLGTVVETAAIIPLDIMVRRRTNCYCGEGTFIALTICWGVGTLVLGPAIWLIPLSRRRKRWYLGHCEVCGYDMHGCMDAPRCPECGSGWRQPRAVRLAQPPAAADQPVQH